MSDDDDGNEINIPLILPAWRDLTDDRTKPYFYQLAMAEFEAQSNYEYWLVPFVFTESKALTDAIDGQTLSRVDYLRDRLQKALKSALRRSGNDPIMFWFAFETNIKDCPLRGQPHYQGSILLRPGEALKARKAFYKINRNCQMTPEEKHGALRFRHGKRKERATKYGQIHADLYWADYNLKERAYNRRHYTDMGNIIAATQSLRKQTEGYYKRLRAEFKLLT